MSFFKSEFVQKEMEDITKLQEKSMRVCLSFPL